MSWKTTVRGALSTQSLEPMLEGLLELWRDTKDARVAELVERLSSTLSATQLRPTGKDVQEKDAAWRALESKGRAADVGVLLATFGEVKRGDVLTHRVEALAKRPADPRIVRALREFIEHPLVPGLTGLRSVELALEALLPIADADTVSALTRLATALVTSPQPFQTNRYLRRALPAAVEALGTRPPPIALSTEDRALLDEVARHLGSSPEDSSRGRAIEELFARVAKDPRDDVSRAMVADVLQERGDPRGEFIALQLARARSGGTRTKREKELVEAHGRAWLGPLAPVVLRSGVAWERGFLSRCSVGTKDRRVAESVVKRPEWATVEDLDVSGWLRDVWLVKETTFPVLRELRGARAEMIPEHSVLEALSVSSVWDRHVPALMAFDGLPALDRLTVETLPLEAGQATAFFKAKLIKRLSFLSLDLWRLDGVVTPALASPIAVIELSTRRDRPWRLRFEGDQVSVHLMWKFASWEERHEDSLIEWLEQIPVGRIRRVAFELERPKPGRALAKVLARFDDVSGPAASAPKKGTRTRT